MKKLLLPLLIFSLTAIMAMPLKSFAQNSITLVGNHTVKICLHATYTDAGYTIVAGTTVTSITTEGSFKNTDETGLFTFRYVAKDVNGGTAFSEYRYVNVVNDASCQSGIGSVNDTKKLFHLFPNPSSNAITLQWDGNTTNFFSYTITDMTGRVIDVSPYISLNGNTYQISTANVPSGMYLLNVQSSQGVSVEKIQIAH